LIRDARHGEPARSAVASYFAGLSPPDGLHVSRLYLQWIDPPAVRRDCRPRNGRLRPTSN
jgi:hypothetical protein